MHLLKSITLSLCLNNVKQKIAIGNYNIACLGFEAEVAQFNGYNTIDGYFYYYPLSYKKTMMEISKKEMKKLKITNIGSHCVLFSKEMLDGKSILNNLELDFKKMKSINTKYIFSTKKIDSDKLKNELFFSHNRQCLFVYEII